MKFEMISSNHSTPKSSVINPFDANKFMKRVQFKDDQQREKKHWWQKFMQGVESKRSEIHRDLSVYRKGI